MDGENSSKPIRMSTIPPTIRTMLSGTPKARRSSVPNSRKKNIKRSAYRHERRATRSCVASSLPARSFRKTGRASSGLMIARRVVNTLTKSVRAGFIPSLHRAYEHELILALSHAVAGPAGEKPLPAGAGQRAIDPRALGDSERRVGVERSLHHP